MVKIYNSRVHLFSPNYRYDNSFHGHSMNSKVFGLFGVCFCLSTYFSLQKRVFDEDYTLIELSTGI